MVLIVILFHQGIWTLKNIWSSEVKSRILQYQNLVLLILLLLINKKNEKTRREVLLILWITGLQKDPHKPEWINNCQDFVHTNLPEKHKSFDSWIHDLKKATKEKRKKN